MTKKWVQCMACDKIDKTVKGNVGTQTVMVCEDCCLPNVSNNAAYCRECCPTGHATRPVDQRVNL